MSYNDVNLRVTSEVLDTIDKKLEYREDGKLYYKILKEFTVKDKIFNIKYGGKRAGSSCGESGYWRVRVLGYHLLEHRVVWYLHHGEFPNSEIDHINRVRSDNRIENLRLATRSDQMKNRSMNRNNKSGINGLRFNSRRCSWIVNYIKNGRRTAKEFKCKLDAISFLISYRKEMNIDSEFSNQEVNL